MTNVTLIVLATLGAAAAAYLGNRWLFGMWRVGAAAVAIPWWEEACKFGAILLLPGSPVLAVHVLFGLLECGYDLWRSERDGLFLGLLTLSGHGLAGGLATLVTNAYGSLGWGYLLAGLTHMLYNLAVLTLVLPTLGAGAYAHPDKR